MSKHTNDFSFVIKNFWGKRWTIFSVIFIIIMLIAIQFHNYDKNGNPKGVRGYAEQQDTIVNSEN